MLHVIIEETRNVHNYDFKFNNNPFDDKVVCFGNVDNIQKRFCSEFEQIYLCGENFLKTGLITRYLKELWDVDWYDDYTFLLHEDGEDIRVTPTHLSYDLQLSMLLLFCAESGLKARITDFLPYMENLAWISKNCEMTIYVNATVVRDLVVGSSEQTRAAEDEERVLDFIWKGEHYNSSWSSFWFDVLRKHFDDLGHLNREAEQYYFDEYLISQCLQVL